MGRPLKDRSNLAVVKTLTYAMFAMFAMTTDSVTIEADRPDSVLNRAIVIHSNKDDKAGNGGAPLACGVLALSTP